MLFGYDGPALWAAFQRSPEAADGAPHPMDRWSRREGEALGARFAADAHFPFGGPPYAPFLSWAQRAGPVWASDIGMLIHGARGLWVGYRFALFFPGVAETPPPDRAAEPDAVRGEGRPCDGCVEKPCVSACPVNAFGPAGYDVEACAGHLRSPLGAPCREGGCLARRACPVGRMFAPEPAQAAFHMAAFLSARST